MTSVWWVVGYNANDTEKEEIRKLIELQTRDYRCVLTPILTPPTHKHTHTHTHTHIHAQTYTRSQNSNDETNERVGPFAGLTHK